MSSNKSTSQFKLSDPIQFLALGFGSGLAPKAPGTFGTVAAIPIFWLMADLSMLNYVLLTTLMGIIGIFICDYSAKAAQVHDHPAIVWDEIVGYLITMFLVPLSFVNILVGFVFFRIFDILKPWPISWIDRKVKGGFGIMIDDVVAGLMAFACMQVFIRFV